MIDNPKLYPAKLIKPTTELPSDATDVYPREGDEFSLGELQAIVGGNIAILRPPVSIAGAILIVKEDYQLEAAGKPNSLASMVMAFDGQDNKAVHWRIHGDALLCWPHQVP